MPSNTVKGSDENYQVDPKVSVEEEVGDEIDEAVGEQEFAELVVDGDQKTKKGGGNKKEVVLGEAEYAVASEADEELVLSLLEDLKKIASDDASDVNDEEVEEVESIYYFDEASINDQEHGTDPSSESSSSVDALVEGLTDLFDKERENFSYLIDTVFSDASPEARDALVDLIEYSIDEDEWSWLPKPELVGNDVLGGNAGAYSASERRIFINEGLPVDEQKRVYLEEVGHFFDTLLQSKAGGIADARDAIGDEGARFRMGLMGELFDESGAIIDSDAYRSAMTEDARGVIVVEGIDGEPVQLNVEFMRGNQRRRRVPRLIKEHGRYFVVHPDKTHLEYAHGLIVARTGSGDVIKGQFNNGFPMGNSRLEVRTPEGVVESGWLDRDGNRTGIWTKRDPSNNVDEILYSRGVKVNGPFEFTDGNGDKVGGEFLRGKPKENSLFRVTSVDGTVKTGKLDRHWEKNGLWTTTDANNNVDKILYRGGERANGVYTIRDGSGETIRGEYVNGRPKEGSEFKITKPEGTVLRGELDYKGRKTGIWTFSSSSSSTGTDQLVYSRGKRVNGHYETHDKNGNKVIGYYDNGRPKEGSQFKITTPEGIIQEGELDHRGRKTGEWINTHPAPSDKSETINYYRGELDGFYGFTTGEETVSGQFSSGGKSGIWITENFKTNTTTTKTYDEPDQLSSYKVESPVSNYRIDS